MSNDILELPGQATLLACWGALAQLSPGAKVVELDGAIAAVLPLVGAAEQRDPSRRRSRFVSG